MTHASVSAGQRFVDEYRANAAHLSRHGLYDPAQEHDACGVGFVAAIDGRPRRQVVEAAIDALRAVWHRGAVDADGKTGDGAGIHVEIPQDFFREQIKSGKDTGGRIAVGMVFLPRTDFAGQERCRTIVETEILGFGYSILGWRQVPVDTTVIGDKAIATRPEIEQIIVGNPRSVSEEDFERELFLIRRRIENQVLAEHIGGFYICSLSCRAVIYKGLFLAEQLSVFYPDLRDPRFVSSFAVFHQRYSTNTWPSWPLAQPFRMLAHNGEINTLRGNLNWMKSHETRMVAPAFGDHNEDVKPIVQAGSSDSSALDAVVEALVRAGRSLPLTKILLVPPAWAKKMAIPQAHKDLFSYCNCVMEPWDGPAALVACDGHWVIGGMDRNGLRPMRYTRTADGLLVVGSETGMVPLVEAEIVEKGRVGPGEMVAVDLERGQVLPRRRAQGPARRREAVRAVGQEHHPPRRPDREARVRAAADGARRAAPPPEPVRDHARGARAAAGADGAGRQGGGGLDGRRHADGGALGALPRPAPLLPPAVQPGDQPADRFLARIPGHEPQDPLRQSRQRLRPGAEPDADPAAREPAAADARVSGAAAALRPQGRGDRLQLRGRRRAGCAARRARADPRRRPRTRCARATSRSCSATRRARRRARRCR